MKLFRAESVDHFVVGVVPSFVVFALWYAWVCGPGVHWSGQFLANFLAAFVEFADAASADGADHVAVASAAALDLGGADLVALGSAVVAASVVVFAAVVG